MLFIVLLFLRTFADWSFLIIAVYSALSPIMWHERYEMRQKR